MEFKSSNPVFTQVSRTNETSYSYVTGKTATFSGIAVKTGVLLAIIFGISAYIWANLETLAPYLGVMMIGGMAVGFISVLVASFSRSQSPFFTILYAVCEGLVLGTISAIVNIGYPGIIMDAVVITFIIFGFLLFAYSTGIFKVGFTFRKVFMTILFGLVGFYIFYFIFGVLLNFAILQLSPGILLALSVIMVVLASFSLLIDFDNCKMAVNSGVPSRYEWYLSLGLLVSLVWLYMEILRILIFLSRYFKD